MEKFSRAAYSGFDPIFMLSAGEETFMADDRSQENAVPVFSTNDEMEARMVQELLQSNGIESAINSESAPGLFPVITGELANQQILVLESEAERACRIIAEEHEAGEELSESGDAPDDAPPTK